MAAIEQNAAKPSYWGQLARQGHEVVQFKDVTTGRFVAVAVDGVVKEYRWKRPATERRSARTQFGSENSRNNAATQSR